MIAPIEITFKSLKLEECCPKCGCIIITDYTFFDKLFRRKLPKLTRKHHKQCKSTVISEAAKTLGKRIDEEIMKDLIQKALKD